MEKGFVLGYPRVPAYNTPLRTIQLVSALFFNTEPSRHLKRSFAGDRKRTGTQPLTWVSDGINGDSDDDIFIQVPKWQSNAQEKTDTKSYHDNDIVIVDFTFLVLYQNSHKMRASRTPQNSPELFREREHQQLTIHRPWTNKAS